MKFYSFFKQPKAWVCLNNPGSKLPYFTFVIIQTTTYVVFVLSLRLTGKKQTPKAHASKLSSQPTMQTHSCTSTHMTDHKHHHQHHLPHANHPSLSCWQAKSCSPATAGQLLSGRQRLGSWTLSPGCLPCHPSQHLSTTPWLLKQTLQHLFYCHWTHYFSYLTSMKCALYFCSI